MPAEEQQQVFLFKIHALYFRADVSPQIRHMPKKIGSDNGGFLRLWRVAICDKNDD